MTPDTPVPLVVGAGPVGLTMANELARHGAGCRIIDRSAKPSQTSKALAIFPRTLEVFETMGIADRFIAAGHRLNGLSLHHRLEQIARIELTSVASPFPFALGLPQSETERLLSEHLDAFGIYRGARGRADELDPNKRRRARRPASRRWARRDDRNALGRWLRRRPQHDPPCSSTWISKARSTTRVSSSRTCNWSRPLPGIASTFSSVTMAWSESYLSSKIVGELWPTSLRIRATNRRAR